MVKRRLIPGKLGKTRITAVADLCASSPCFSVIAASDQARIRCLLAVISVTLDHDKNEDHEGGYVETFNRDSKLFSRNAHFDSRAGTDEGSGD
jgi:hypothetical protein